ncbi:hypothetical protein [Microvirga arsenatis]|uniref:Uncharacterized protein n=1 Tax=Microvirga arsenatis TaxID=2692265 RepID=A0ABW9Z0F6_9HYPH|nr:hypothetical protein [Microvirga arsenatis]NBJ13355.1 hypothetical protein [Microvirga arsenatis]NBJ24139.1 hypothetical protein [Microvirga arsenatis]
MARLEIGPTVDQLRELAEAAIDRHFEPVRHRMALYTRKVARAEQHLAGRPSAMINREAQRRHIKADDIARQIVALADADEAMEDQRVALKLKVRKALTAEKIRKLLSENGIALAR